MRSDKNRTTLSDRCAEFFVDLCDVHGTATNIGTAIRIHRQHLLEMATGARRSILELFVEFVQALRRLDHPMAEASFLFAARELGYIAVRAGDAKADTEHLSSIYEKLSKLHTELAEANQDGTVDPKEHGELADAYLELCEVAHSSALYHRAMADAKVAIRRVS